MHNPSDMPKGFLAYMEKLFVLTARYSKRFRYLPVSLNPTLSRRRAFFYIKGRASGMHVSYRSGRGSNPAGGPAVVQLFTCRTDESVCFLFILLYLVYMFRS